MDFILKPIASIEFSLPGLSVVTSLREWTNRLKIDLRNRNREAALITDYRGHNLIWPGLPRPTKLVPTTFEFGCYTCPTYRRLYPKKLRNHSAISFE